MSEKIAFTVVKDEAPFLLEWVMYHRTIGFDSVVVYSNNCTDQTDRLCAALAAKGLVEHHVHDPQDRSPQGHAAWLFARSRRAKEGDWVFFCDPDEFLNIKLGAHHLDDLLARMNDSQGILLPWRMFGDAGRAHFTGRSIDPAYCRAAATANPNNRVVKTLFRYGPQVEFIGVHVPKMMPEYWTHGRPFRSARLTDIDPALPPYQKWRHAGQIVTCDQTDTSYDHVQVNHYYARSRACFALKHRRGVGGVSLQKLGEERRKYEGQNYDASNFNDVEDTSILAMLPSLDKAMQSVLSFDTVKAIHDATRLDFLRFEAEFLADSFQG